MKALGGLEDNSSDWHSFCHANEGTSKCINENSLLVLLCPTTVYRFDWARASVVGNGLTREQPEACNATPTCKPMNGNISGLPSLERILGAPRHVITGHMPRPLLLHPIIILTDPYHSSLGISGNFNLTYNINLHPAPY